MISCPAAETFLKPPSASLDWWDPEVQRKRLLAEAESLHPERALWTALTWLTTAAGDLVHGKAATAAARMGGAASASIHVAAAVASQAVYQFAVAPAGRRNRLAVREQVPAERWPLGVEGSRLVVF